MAKSRRNLEQGFYDQKGQFHPVRRSGDYDSRRESKDKGFKGEVFGRDRRTKQYHLIPLGKTQWKSKAEAINAANEKTKERGKRQQYTSFKAVTLGSEPNPNPMRRKKTKKNPEYTVEKNPKGKHLPRIVRDHIRAGRNQKQILDLMKRAGFSKAMLLEARKIYTQEKNFVRKMRTGKNPSGKKILSTVKKAGGKVLKVAGGAISGAVRGIEKAAKKNSTKLTDQELILLRAAFRVQPGGKSGGLMSVSDILNKTSLHWSKAKKKTVLKHLVEKGILAAHRHDFPGSLTAKQKSEMLVFKSGRGKAYYIGVALRDPDALPREALQNPKQRKRNQSGAEDRREQFAGKVGEYLDLYIPGNIPSKGLSGIGPMVKICTDAGDFKPTAGHIYYLQDGKEKLYAGSVEKKPMANPNMDFGKVYRVEYECKKPHLGYPGKTIWYHDFENPLPRLRSDSDGMLHFSGGGYKIEREGIVG